MSDSVVTEIPAAGDPAAVAYQRARIEHWSAVARAGRRWGMGSYYHRRLGEIFRFLVAPNQKVLELGCAGGDLLAALSPAAGSMGVDFSPEMIARATAAHSGYRFIAADVQALELDETFDVIILSDLVNDLWDVQGVLQRLRRLCHPRTRLIVNFFSHIWQGPLSTARRLGLATPNLRQNWLTREDLRNLLTLSGFEALRMWPEVLWPVRTPGIDALANKVLVRLPGFRALALTNFCIARPAPVAEEKAATVSVIVPARNEAGNVPAIVARVPEMGAGTEIIFVEGHSSDDTYSAIERVIAENPGKPWKLFRQTGKGKGDAVRLGFGAASGDILMILDADLTVPPEDLPRFYEALHSRLGEFINGVRLVYPMEAQAMRFLNLLGNKFFGRAFSWIFGQDIRDTLCGTKVLYKADYEKIAANRAYFGDFDPFGDFDLLFGAAKQNLKILDLPIRYRDRTYGTTNINRFRHGLLLLRMTAFAARRLKFV